MCNSVKRRQLLNWAVVVTSFNCCIKSEELRETVGLKVKERKARDERERERERERSRLHYVGYVLPLQY